MNIVEIVSNIGDYVTEVKDFIVNFFSFFVDIINLIPSPFREILLAFEVIIVVIIGIRIWGNFS